MRLLIITLFLVVFVCPTNAQLDIEYGQPEDLNGVRKIYVNTGTDLNGRDNIIKVIKKDLPDIVIVSSVEEADVALIYSSDSYSVLGSIIHSRNSSTTGTVSVYGNHGTYSGRTTTSSSSTPIFRKVTDGEGLVVKFMSNGRSRLLMNFKDTKKSVLERRPSTNFARKFVRVYKDVNAVSLSRSQPITTMPPSQPVGSLPKIETGNTEPLNLNGMWNYAGGLVRVAHSGQSVKVTYTSPNGCNGLSVTDLLAGQLQGTTLSGKMMICTNEKLVTSCSFPPTSEISFTATVDQNNISVIAKIPGMSISYGSDGRCNVNSDSKQNSEYKFTLTRSNY